MPYLRAASVRQRQLRRLRAFMKPPHLADRFSTTGPFITTHKDNKSINFIVNAPHIIITTAVIITTGEQYYYYYCLELLKSCECMMRHMYGCWCEVPCHVFALRPWHENRTVIIINIIIITALLRQGVFN